MSECFSTYKYKSKPRVEIEFKTNKIGVSFGIIITKKVTNSFTIIDKRNKNK